MKKEYWIIWIGLFCFSFIVRGQDVGIVKFFVEVDNGYFEIEVNDTLLLKRYKDTLPAGHYEAKVWSPGYIVAPIEFDVVAGKTTEKHVEMAKNNDYIRYESEYKDYRMKFHKNFSLPLSLSLGSAITTGIFMVNAYDKRKEILSDVNLYQKSVMPSEIAEIKERTFENNRKYNRYRTGFFIGSGITLGLVGTTIWAYRKFNRENIEPTFDKTSPFKDKYTLNITPYGCSLRIKIG